MSWGIVIWSMVISACLTLAALHGLVWCRKRSEQASLLFALMALGNAGLACCELWMARAETPTEFATAVRWLHVPSLLLCVALVGFVRVHLRAGRRWLAWSICGLRAASLALNFLTGVNLNYREVIRLRLVPFLGDVAAVADSVPNPWMLVGQASLLLLLVFAADAGLAVYRRGDRRLALVTAASIVFFTAATILQAVVVCWGAKDWPLLASWPFMAILAVVAYALSLDVVRTAQLDRDLRAAEERYRGIFEGALEGMFRTSPEGRVLIANPALATMLGYESADEVVREVQDTARQVWVSQEDRTRLKRLLQQQGSVRRRDCQFRRKDGSTIWVSLSSRNVHGPDGRLAFVDGFIEDITERKRDECALRESQARLASGVELAGLGFYEIVDGEHVTYVDDLMRATCGLPPEATQGIPARDFWLAHIHPDDVPRILDANQRLNDGRMEKISLEYRYSHPDGRELWIQHLSIVKHRNSAGRAVLNIGVIRDITEQRRVAHELSLQRMQLAHMARVSTIGQLASALAHELNQPLGAILRNAEAAELLLQEPSPDLDEVRAILADIRHDDQRAGGVIERMRALMRRGEVEARQLDLNHLTGDVIALLRQETEMRRARVVLELDPALPPVHGDVVQLQQVVLNLLLNAIDAVRDSSPERRLVTVRSRPAGAMVELAVCDRGHGIPPDDLARIFEPFVTSKSNGLGMGLPISRSIIEAHGGHLRTENNAGGGATFTFALPAVKAGAE